MNECDSGRLCDAKTGEDLRAATLLELCLSLRSLASESDSADGHAGWVESDGRWCVVNGASDRDRSLAWKWLRLG